MGGGSSAPKYGADLWEHISVYPSNIKSYAKLNHTLKFKSETKTMAVRRGTSVGFNFSCEGADVASAIEEATQFSVYLTSELDSSTIVVHRSSSPTNGWELQMKPSIGNNQFAEVVLKIPPTAPFGRYEVEFESTEHGTRIRSLYNIVILFNPWNPQDTVYLENDAERTEYILSELGQLFMGKEKTIKSSPWVFAQYESYVMESILHSLQGTNNNERSNPVLMSRLLAAKVNSQDDNGFIVGKWEGNFDDGTPPHRWSSSAPILYEYHTSGGKPVKYGQCWVFAGVLTTCMRCIGIPCRPITTYSSGHDTGLNKVIDRYFNRHGALDEKKTKDTVWNFHVWNEVWMKRPDLSNQSYNGWQALDSTPQERSEGIYQTGPAPLEAIKNGVDETYDTKFLFAEVNADIRYWVPNPKDQSEFVLAKIDPVGIGKRISTKAVGSNDCVDITNLYKHPEGSIKERQAAFLGTDAVGKTLLDVERLEQKKSKLTCTFAAETTGMFGAAFKVVLSVDTVSKEPTEVQFAVGIFASSHDSKESQTIRKFSGMKQTPFSVQREISYDDYESFFRGKNGNTTSIECTCYGIETAVGAAAQDAQESGFAKTMGFSFVLPTLDLSYGDGKPDTLSTQEQAFVKVSFLNPLPISLENCVATAMGTNLTGLVGKSGPIFQRDIGEIGVAEQVEFFIEVDPEEPGDHDLLVTLDCDELQGVSGHIILPVEA